MTNFLEILKRAPSSNT